MSTGRHAEMGGPASLVFVVSKQPPVKKSRKKFFAAAALALAAAFSIAGYVAVSRSQPRAGGAPVFSVRKINVYGLDGSSAELVREAMAPFVGRSLTEISSEDVGNSVAGFGFVEGFLLKKQYPSEISVEIRKKPSVGFARVSGRFYEMDGQGHCWEAGAVPDAAFEASASCDLEDRGFQGLVRSMTEMGLYGRVALVEPEKPGSFLLTTAEGRKVVVFPADFPGQWSKYTRSVEWIEKNFGRRCRLDLRWSGRVVLTPPPPVTRPAEEDSNG